MTKKITYVCNHCRKEIDGEPNGFGIHFIGNAAARTEPLRDTENHLCADCARGYAMALKDTF